MKDVVIYTTDTCPYCRQAERFLEAQGVPFTGVDVTDDEAMREKLVELSGGRRTVPQIFIDGEGIGGFDDLAKLEREGRLNAMLGLADDR